MNVMPMQLMMPAESAHDTVEALGEVGLLQFKDLNKDKSAFQRTFANQVFKRARGNVVHRQQIVFPSCYEAR